MKVFMTPWKVCRTVVSFFIQQISFPKTFLLQRATFFMYFKHFRSLVIIIIAEVVLRPRLHLFTISPRMIFCNFLYLEPLITCLKFSNFLFLI